MALHHGVPPPRISNSYFLTLSLCNEGEKRKLTLYTKRENIQQRKHYINLFFSDLSQFYLPLNTQPFPLTENKFQKKKRCISEAPAHEAQITDKDPEGSPVQPTDIHAASNQAARAILAQPAWGRLSWEMSHRENRLIKAIYMHATAHCKELLSLSSDVGEENKQPLPAPSADNKHAIHAGRKTEVGPIRDRVIKFLATVNREQYMMH